MQSNDIAIEGGKPFDIGAADGQVVQRSVAHGRQSPPSEPRIERALEPRRSRAAANVAIPRELAAVLARDQEGISGPYRSRTFGGQVFVLSLARNQSSPKRNGAPPAL